MKLSRRRSVRSGSREPRMLGAAAVVDLPAADDWLEPFDGALLERARQHWREGSWDELRRLDIEAIHAHPDRARLALLVAAGHLESADRPQTRRFVHAAIEWGCDRRLLSQVLISGLLNTLGCAWAAAGKQDRAGASFEAAVQLSDPAAAVRLVAHARCMRELVALGLLGEAAQHVADGHRLLGQPGWRARDAVAHRKIIDIEVDWLRNRVAQLQRRLDMAGGAIGAVPATSSAAPAAVSAEDPGARYFGLHKLDRKLEIYVNFDRGYYVELGANDGVAQSNTLHFERERGWRGLLIEPILHNYLKCRENRAADNRFACAACVSFDYDKPYVALTYANLMTTPSGLESDIEDLQAHVDVGRVYLPKGETTVDVLAPARTLCSLLDEAQAPATVDLLSLDVEGAELEVLRGIDHTRQRFRFMLIESRDPMRLEGYLGSQGYRLLDKLSQHDYLFASTLQA